MNDNLVIEELKKWAPDEEFYRAFYLRKQSEMPVDDLFNRKDLDQEIIEWASNPATIDPNKTEEDFFNAGRNVQILKHPRYFPFFLHKHTFFEINYVLFGHCIEIINDCTVELKEGDICLLAHGITHGILVNDDSIVLNILIRYSTFMDIFLNTVRDKSQISMFFLNSIHTNEKNKIRYLIYHTQKDSMLRSYILDMYTEQMHLDDYSDRIICSLLTIFFTQLTRRHGKDIEISDKRDSDGQYMDEILQYIMENYKTITLSSLAEHFHFSVPYCSKIVKSFCGYSFSSLLTRIRLQQGENMLAHTQMSIADIGDYIGYKNPETFIRAFNRIYHLSPSQYRKQGARYPLDLLASSPR